MAIIYNVWYRKSQDNLENGQRVNQLWILGCKFQEGTMVVIIDCSSIEKGYLPLPEIDGAKPTLACTYPSNDEAAQSYIDALISKSRGIVSVTANIVSSEEDIKRLVSRWNTEKTIHGILIISPPKTLTNPHSLIVDHKNVEGNDFDDRLDRVSCTARAIIVIITQALNGPISLLCTIEEQIEGKNVLIIGYGKAVGKPLSYLLMRHHIGSVTIIHKYSKLKASCRALKDADIIVSATGNPEIFTDIASNIKCVKGKIIIDVGISKNADGKIVGDIHPDFAELNQVTPVPGGVGAVTTAMILSNTTRAFHGLLT